MDEMDSEIAMRPKEPIPAFASREEEAEFWDTHDLADYWDDFMPTDVRFSIESAEGILVRLDPETLTRLRVKATESGVGPATLVRTWILEHLKDDQTPSRSSG